MLHPHELPLQQEIVVVGDGRVGRAFAEMAGPRTRLVRRGQAVTTEETENNAYPIVVATHCSDLDAVLAKTCESRWKDLVFVQNGMLQPWLKQHHLQNNTQVLLFMSASPENPSEPKGRMRVHGGGDSCAWGRWADTISLIMQKGGLQCSVVSQDTFLGVMIEKLLWSSIFWLLSDALGGLSVGEIAQYHNCLVQELTGELLPLALSCGSLPKTITPSVLHHQLAESEMVERLCAYSRGIFPAVPNKQVALSEFDWRNGWFLAQRATPCHLKWLKTAGIECTVGSK